MKNYINKKIIAHKRIRGIAFVESLMAMSVIIISIMAPLTLLSQSAKYTKFALNKITATSLAEEQIELMINYKKSLDIFCFNNPSECDGNFDGFDSFVKKVNDITVNCVSYPLPGNPCYLDDTSFDYSNTTIAPVFNKKPSCKIYEEADDISKCSQTATSKPTSFSRRLYIDNLDQITLLSPTTAIEVIDNVIRLTSVVCINKNNCATGDPNAVTLVYYIYR